MKILYLDCGISPENYSLNPSKYGGGGVVARHLKQRKDITFTVLAPEEAFDGLDLKKDNFVNCGVISKELCEKLKQGFPIDKVFNLNGTYDLILHGHCCFTFGRHDLKIPVVHWSFFDGAAGHPHNDYILLYNKTFKAQFGEKAKYVTLGKSVPKYFEKREKEDFVFQCSRHDELMNSIETAKQCLKYGIKGIFAGPIHNNYPLMDYIDNKTTYYVGEISEQEKMAIHKRARLFMLPHNWEVPFNQSVIEAQGLGTPILVNRRGPFFNDYLIEGVNGWHYNGDNFLECWNKAKNINQYWCWQTASHYSIERMEESFIQAFKEIINETK